MGRNKAVILAFNTLHKVCLPNHSFIPLKPLGLLKNLNTWAVEDGLEFDPKRGCVVSPAEECVDGQWQDSEIMVVKPSDRIMLNSIRQSYKIDDYKAACSYGEDVGMMFLEAEKHDQATLEDLDANCMEGGDIRDAVEILRVLLHMGTSVDLPRYLNIMKICKGEVDLSVAKGIHKHLVKSFCPIRVNTISISNEILQMYARCESMSDAYTVFCKMSERNLATWGIMIRGYVQNGLGEEAIDMFTRFKETAGNRPDGEMYLEVFDACAQVGDVVEGMLHFESMSKVYGIVPTMKHYAGIVKMLGSSGHLEEALEFIERMPVKPSIDVWEKLINLCRVHGNSELGDHCVEVVKELDSFRLTEEMNAGLVPVLVDEHYRTVRLRV